MVRHVGLGRQHASVADPGALDQRPQLRGRRAPRGELRGGREEEEALLGGRVSLELGRRRHPAARRVLIVEPRGGGVRDGLSGGGAVSRGRERRGRGRLEVPRVGGGHRVARGFRALVPSGSTVVQEEAPGGQGQLGADVRVQLLGDGLEAAVGARAARPRARTLLQLEVHGAPAGPVQPGGQEGGIPGGGGGGCEVVLEHTSRGRRGLAHDRRSGQGEGGRGGVLGLVAPL